MNQYIIREKYAEIIVESRKFGNKYVQIDLEDVEKCKKYHWYARKDHSIKTKEQFYIGSIIKNSNVILLHRYLTNCPSDMVVDHKNRNTLDNRKANLEVCTAFKNAQNRRTNTNVKTGVNYNSQTGKWTAQIKNGQKTIYLGTFKLFEEAANARLNAEIMYKCN